MATFVTRCPQCGHPVALSLATAQRIRCGACGFDGAPPAEDARRLASAQAIVHEANVRERQLGPLQSRLLTSNLVANLLYLGGVALALVPYGCCLFVLMQVYASRGNYVAMSVGVIPIVFLLVFAASGFFFLRSRLRRIRAALMGLPGLEPGQPASCRLCGGDIQTGEVRAVVRCSYCDADNLVDPSWLRSQERARDATLDTFEADVGEQARIAKQAFRSAWRGVALAALIATPVTVCLWFVGYTAATQIEGEPIELRYAIVDFGDARCVAAVRGWDDENDEVSGTDSDDGDATFYVTPGSVETFGPERLVGMRLIPYRTDLEGEVTRLFGIPLEGTNKVLLRNEDGTETSIYPSWTCLAPGQEPPVTPYVPDESASE